MLILPNHQPSPEAQEQEIRRIQARNEKVFKAFIVGSALLCVLIILAILLRWSL